MKKPSKCWQFGVDLLLNENGDIHLIEVNNGSVVVLPTSIEDKSIYYDERIDGIDNVGYSTKLYTKYLIKYLKSVGINHVRFYFIWEYSCCDIKKMISEELKKEGITIGYDGYPIYCEEDLVTKQNTDWWSGNKTIIKDNINQFIKDGITPISKIGEYKKESKYPNFLLKPIYGGKGNGIIFYKQKDIIEKKGFITEEFMVAESVTESYNFINGKLTKKLHSPRLCDYRPKIIIDDLGNVAYMGAHRRTSSIDIPNTLEDGEIDSSHPNYDTYLCNATKNAYRTLLTDEEQDFWEEISVKVGKTLYKLFLKDE